MEKKSQKLYPADYNLLILEDLLQAHNQIVLIILLKEFMKLNVKTNKIIKTANRVELNTKIATAFFNRKNLKII